MCECDVFMCATCETTGLSQQECAPRHEEEQSCLQQLEVPQFGELGHVQTTVKEFNKILQNEFIINLYVWFM